MKKGIIFDMDGTLWDSAPQVAASWNIAMEQCHYKREPLTAKDIQNVMGKTMEDIADILFAGAGPEKKKELLAACCEVENEYLREHGGTLYPEIRATMEKLKETYHLYIVSNCQSGYIEAFLDYYSFHDLVEDIQCYGDNGKPKADNIRIVCDRNALDDAVYVGDIQGDYDSSVAAGVRFIHAGYGFGTVDADVPELSSFDELVREVPQILGY